MADEKQAPTDEVARSVVIQHQSHQEAKEKLPEEQEVLIPGEKNAPILQKLLPHQYDVISNQLDAGLFTSVFQTFTYLDAVVQAQLTGKDVAKITEELKQRPTQKNTYDAAAGFVNASGMAREVVIHTQKAYFNFLRHVSNDVVAPLQSFHTASVKKRIDLNKSLVESKKKLSLLEKAIAAERVDNMKQLEALRDLTLQKNREDAAGATSRLYPLLAKRFVSAKKDVSKSIRKYERNLELARESRNRFYKEELPANIDQLEKLERSRLSMLTNYLNKFQLLFSTLVIELKQSTDLLEKLLPSLDPQGTFQGMAKTWIRMFGPPPEIAELEYGLPCTADHVDADAYMHILDRVDRIQVENENPSLLHPAEHPFSAPATSEPSPSPSPSSSSSSSSASASSSSSSSAPVESKASSPFKATPAAVAAENKMERSHAAKAAGEGGGDEEQVIAVCEALFDFSLDSDPSSDVVYLTLKIGDRISVFELDDEWWFGQLERTGEQGFFPQAYVKRIS